MLPLKGKCSGFYKDFFIINITTIMASTLYLRVVLVTSFKYRSLLITNCGILVLYLRTINISRHAHCSGWISGSLVLDTIKVSTVYMIFRDGHCIETILLVIFTSDRSKLSTHWYRIYNISKHLLIAFNIYLY